jgi:DNA repair photolyase
VQSKSLNRGKNSKSAFGTYEWAAYNANFISGCNHDCKYCYSKEMAIRFGRKTNLNWKKEEVRREDLKKVFTKKNGTIMFPSSHDIHPDHLNQSIKFLKNILSPGNNVLVVSKPHYECIKAICTQFDKNKTNMMFRFSIGSIDSDVLKFWEPGAPCFTERLKSLKYAYDHGFKTSVSCEPMLDNNIGAIITKVLPYVTDAVWIGKANFLLRRLKTNNCNDAETLRRAQELIEWQSDENILSLYEKYRKDRKIKWKESIKKVVGIEGSKQKGMDI